MTRVQGARPEIRYSLFAIRRSLSASHSRFTLPANCEERTANRAFQHPYPYGSRQGGGSGALAPLMLPTIDECIEQ